MSADSVVLEEAVGLETSGGTHTPVMVRGLHLPARWSKTFRTADDGQEQVVIHVLQGNSTSAVECRLVGRFAVDGLPARPRHQVSFMVTLSVDRQGNLSLSALDRSGQEHAVCAEPLKIRTQLLSDFTGLGGRWGSW